TLRHLNFEWLDRQWAFEAWEKARSWRFPGNRLHDWFVALQAMLGSALLIIPLVGFAPQLWRSRRTKFLCVLALIMFAASFVEVTFFMHYAAPFAAAFLILTVQAMRRLRSDYLAIVVLAVIFGRDAWQIAQHRTPDQFGAVNRRKQSI